MMRTPTTDDALIIRRRRCREPWRRLGESHPRCIIHTIGLDLNAGATVMKQIAAENKGENLCCGEGDECEAGGRGWLRLDVAAKVLSRTTSDISTSFPEMSAGLFFQDGGQLNSHCHSLKLREIIPQGGVWSV